MRDCGKSPKAKFSTKKRITTPGRSWLCFPGDFSGFPPQSSTGPHCRFDRASREFRYPPSNPLVPLALRLWLRELLLPPPTKVAAPSPAEKEVVSGRPSSLDQLLADRTGGRTEIGVAAGSTQNRRTTGTTAGSGNEMSGAFSSGSDTLTAGLSTGLLIGVRFRHLRRGWRQCHGNRGVRQ